MLERQKLVSDLKGAFRGALIKAFTVIACPPFFFLCPPTPINTRVGGQGGVPQILYLTLEARRAI